MSGTIVGFYCGLAILYPYGPIYCPKDDCLGSCYGLVMFNAQSAPLPTHEKQCQWADINGEPNKNWYQWKPRLISEDRQASLSARAICYLEDRGTPKNLNDLER